MAFSGCCQSPFLFCNSHVADHGGRSYKLSQLKKETSAGQTPNVKSVDVLDGNIKPGVFSQDGIQSWIAEGEL